MPDTDVEPPIGFLERMPKVELHLHLEGAIPLHALWKLIQKYGGSELTEPEQLESRFAYTDFPHFIETWNWKNQFLREYEDFTFVAEEVARDLADQNIRYVEAFFSAPDFAHHGLGVGPLAEAIRKGLDRQSDRIEIQLIADIVRDRGPQAGLRVVAELAELSDYGVVGVGMGGSEHDYPPQPFATVYEHARELGLHTTAHAGEAAGPESIWGALQALAVERIGHGTRAVEDSDLIDHLTTSRIPIECCPISNCRTGVVSSLASHPIRRYFDLGMNVCVNTDDPKMFNTSMVGEYRALVDTLNFAPHEIVALADNAINSSWASGARRVQLSEELHTFVASQTRLADEG